MKETYLDLLGQQWTLPEIDNMDILYYWKLLLYSKNKEDPEIFADDYY